MDIQELIKEYESKVAENKKNLDNLFERDDEELKEITSKTNDLCERLKEMNISISHVDKIDVIAQEIEEIYILSQFLSDGYDKISSINKENIDEFMNGYIQSFEFTSKLPAIQSNLLNQIRQIVKNQKEELILLIKTEWEKEFMISDEKIFLGKNLEKIKNYMQIVGIWDEIKKNIEENTLKIFYRCYNKRTSMSITQEIITKFNDICINIKLFLCFFQKFLVFDIDIMEKFFEVIIKVIEEHAGICASDFNVKKQYLKEIELLEAALFEIGFNPSGKLLKIIVNCEEISEALNKKQFLNDLREFLLLPSNEFIQVENNITITINTHKYIESLKKTFNLENCTQFQAFMILSTIKEAIVMFQALRGIKVSENIKEMLYFCSDLEYFIKEIEKIADFKKKSWNYLKFSDYLDFLTDYSDILPLIEQQLNDYYEKVYSYYKNLLMEKVKLFNFNEFEEKFRYQEAVLISILGIIKKNEMKGILPNKKCYKILGKFIDDLIFHTISKILSLKDIYIKDIQLIKHFFDTIFDVKDIFDGESPIDYCKQWERLEALLEIIEGKLIDIVTMYERKRFLNLFNAGELRKLIEALFSDSDKRRKTLNIII